jgi:anaerobic magnesium-protoporphyrin IX monomethyl ester cyclase
MAGVVPPRPLVPGDVDGLRVLSLWPPHVPSYFNAGHRLVTFQVAGYLRRREDVAQVRAVDAGGLTTTWKELGDLLFEGWDVVAIANDHDAVDGLERTIRYVRSLSPGSAIVTFGRLSHESPAFFQQFDLDGIVQHGDNERGVAAFVDWAKGKRPAPLPGVAVREAGEWLLPDREGEWLDTEDLVLPDVGEIPYPAYDLLYRREANSFCGIPERRELVVPLARGCPVQCSFCDVPSREGLRERRLTVEVVLDYIRECFAQMSFDYVAMYAPTFTLNQGWVRSFCERVLATGMDFSWKCTTTPRHLNRELVSLMGRAGCKRISVGLETLDAEAQRGLPRLKQVGVHSLEELSSWCNEAGVELNCFVIVGLPGSSVAGDESTVAKVKQLGARVRPMMYTPFNEIAGGMSSDEVSGYNRQFQHGGASDEDQRRRYSLVFGASTWRTPVIDRIPRRDR